MSGSIQFLARAIRGHGYSETKPANHRGHCVRQARATRLPGALGKIESRVKTAWAERQEKKAVKTTSSANDVITEIKLNMLRAGKESSNDLFYAVGVEKKPSTPIFDPAAGKTVMETLLAN